MSQFEPYPLENYPHTGRLESGQVVPQGMTDKQASHVVPVENTNAFTSEELQDMACTVGGCGVCGRVVNYPAIPDSSNCKASLNSSNPKDVACKNKLPVYLVPPELVRQVASVLKNGADKYGEFNWRTKPVQLRNYLSAIVRHTLCLMDGEDIDTESGLPHIAHIASTCSIVMDAIKHKSLIDDRWKARWNNGN